MDPEETELRRKRQKRPLFYGVGGGQSGSLRLSRCVLKVGLTLDFVGRLIK